MVVAIAVVFIAIPAAIGDLATTGIIPASVREKDYPKDNGEEGGDSGSGPDQS